MAKRVIDPEWLRERYPVMTDINELLDDHEREFGWRPTKASVYMKASRMGLRKMPVSGRGDRAERTIRWSKEPEMEAWMLEHDHGQRIDLLREEFRERWGFGISRGQVNLFRASHGTQVRKNHNGGRPRVPVGTERVSKDGYIVIKIADEPTVPMSKDNWRLKHVWIWEKANGRELPKGHNVYFADGDKTNFTPDNLVAVPKRLVGAMSDMGLTWHDRDSLMVAVGMAEVRLARRNLERKVEHTCAICGATYVNDGNRNPRARVCPECASKGRRAPYKRKNKYDPETIRALHAKGMRQYQIAEALGCTPSTVSLALGDGSARRSKRKKAVANGKTE